MPQIINECAPIIKNDEVGPNLYSLKLLAPQIAQRVLPGQFVHMKIPRMADHILRRPFSLYTSNPQTGAVSIVYQVVGYGTKTLAHLKTGISTELLGPVGNAWSPVRANEERRSVNRALIVGGGVGAAPLFMLAQTFVAENVSVDVILGAQTKDAHVCLDDYTLLLGREPFCATDDGTYGKAGFCTSLVKECLEQASSGQEKPYDYVAVCGPVPLMRIVAEMAQQKHIYCEVSLERRMACGIGACLSCVVDTTGKRRRSCVDGPIFDAAEIVW